MAERWVLGRPVALNLDIDVVRGLLGADATPDGGRAALKLAIAISITESDVQRADRQLWTHAGHVPRTDRSGVTAP
jgi:hypothetical protein